METRSIFRSLSPLDHRYYLANRELFERLADFLSEEATIRSCIRAEAALLASYLRMRIVDPATRERYLELTRELPEKIPPEEVYAEEEKTQHNVRALVNVMKRYLPEEIRHLVHLGATSVDILDSAMAMRIRDAVRKVVLPLLIDLEEGLAQIAKREAGTPQVGRTHGQHAVPVTVGFAFAEYVSRLGKSIAEIEHRSRDLRGKLAGAVGSYNATSLTTSDPAALERDYLAGLGLEPSEHSTQLVEPEYLLRLLLEMNVAFGIIANLADDLRNLQRSEIGEVREEFGGSQVGSSTMPQKRNPWNSEHVKSLWKTFSPRVMTFYADQISEHQRDLTNSASSRFVAEYIAGFVAAAARMKKIIAGLGIDRSRLEANLRASGEGVLAEPAYILLASSGESDAHEIVRKATLESEKEGIGLAEALRRQPGAWETIRTRMAETAGIEPEEFFSRPERYSGRAQEIAERIAERYLNEARRMREVLES